VKARYLKWISVAFVVAIICIAFVFLSMNSTQSKKMSEIASDFPQCVIKINDSTDSLSIPII